MKDKANLDIRKKLAEARKQCVYSYDVADKLQISESTFMKRLRHEMTTDMKAEVSKAISDLLKG